MSVDAAQKAGAVTLNYGIFINVAISFVIVAWAVFLLIKAMNRLNKAEPAPPPAPPETPEDVKLLREIRDALKDFVKSYEPAKASRTEVGHVIDAGDGIAHVEGLPSAMAKGFAAVCCRENPSPTTINPLKSMGKEAVLAAGINIKLPIALITNPNAMPFP